MQGTSQGSPDARVSQIVRNNKFTAPTACYRQKSVDTSAEQGDEGRAEKVRRIKEQLAQGQYHVEAAEAAKKILRSEISRLLSGRTENNK